MHPLWLRVLGCSLIMREHVGILVVLKTIIEYTIIEIVIVGFVYL